MRELLLAITVMVSAVRAPEPGFAPRALRIEQDGVLLAEVWPVAGEMPQKGRAQERSNFSRIGEGNCIGLMRLARPWSDYRGRDVRAGTYRLIYRIQPILKDHFGTARYRDFAVLEGGSETAHPIVMSLVPADEGDAVLDSGGVRFGLVFEGKGEPEL